MDSMNRIELNRGELGYSRANQYKVNRLVDRVQRIKCIVVEAFMHPFMHATRDAQCRYRLRGLGR